jgi:hypothetical protein
MVPGAPAVAEGLKMRTSAAEQAAEKLGFA